MKSYVTSVAVSLFVTGGLILASCSKDRSVKGGSHGSGEHVMTPDWKFTLPQGDPVEGRKVYVELECYKCHEINGESFPDLADTEGRSGPELSQMAASHPVEFFAESIVNPNAVIDSEDKEKGYVTKEGRSKMPDYGDVLTVRQLVDLATYVASLKGEKHSGH